MIDTSDLDNFARRLDAAPDRVERMGERTAHGVARDIADMMQREAPLDTGELAASMDVEDGTVTVDAPYARFVEYGTANMAPQPFARPALRRHRPEYITAIGNDAIEAI